MGSLSLLQGIFPTQGSNPGLLHYRWILYQLNHKGSKQKRLRRGGKNTQKNYIKKDLHDQGNHDGVSTNLEPDILEYKVKWALGSITMNKAGGGDGIPVELFQILST